MPQALIVEDEPEVNELLALLIQHRGYETVSAFTGGEALEIARRARPDVVFLDLMLPDLSGYDVCRTLGSERATTAIPVVMVTARVAPESRIQGFRMGAAEYIPKPYTPTQIFAALSHADAWRLGFDAEPTRGEFVFRSEPEADHLFRLTRLRTLILTRTSLAELLVRDLIQNLVDVAVRAVEWGRARDLDAVASLGYRCDDRGVTLTLRDRSGWFADDPPHAETGLGGLLARGGLLRVEPGDGPGWITLKVLGTPGSPTSDGRAES